MCVLDIEIRKIDTKIYVKLCQKLANDLKLACSLFCQ